MPPIAFRGYTRGLWAAGPSELSPPTSLRRARGVHALKTGDVRSRAGSTLHVALAGPPHSVFVFGGVHVSGVGTQVFREAVAVALAAPIPPLVGGGRLTFVSMPCSVGKTDSLYVAGGNSAFVVDAAGAATAWGLTPPSAALTAADAGLGGALQSGTYLYFVTFLNDSKGIESNSAPSASVVVTNLHKVALSNIPVSADPQVTGRNLYRTVAGGSQGFFLAKLPNNVDTTYTDLLGDAALGFTTTPLTHNAPSPVPSFCFGPYQNRIFWLVTTTGRKGTLYFSESGLPDANLDLLPVTNDNDPLQAGCVWNAALWVFSQRSLFAILGNYPFVARQYREVPGTLYPYTVVPTPLGIMYGAVDGIRVFDGQSSQLVAPGALGPLFQNESLENLTAFTPLVAAFHNNEYVVSDGVQTLALNISDFTWRDVGVGVTALFQDPDDGLLHAGLGTNCIHLEDPTAPFTDAGAAIPFEVEWPAKIIGDEFAGFVRYLRIEANTQGQFLTPSVVLDGAVSALPAFQTPSRQAVEFPIAQPARTVGVRLVGSLTAQVEVPLLVVDVDLGASQQAVATPAEVKVVQ